MKKLLLLSTICLLANTAHSMDIRPYIEGRISFNSIKAEYKELGFNEDFKDNVFGGSAEIGGKTEQLKVGLELFYNDDLEDKLLKVVPVKGETKGFFLNGYYEIPLSNDFNKIKPYLGAGIGYSWLKASLDATFWGLGKESVKDDCFSWNIGFGSGYELNKNTDLTLGYRYENLGKIKEADSETKFTNHKVYLGLRYSF